MTTYRRNQRLIRKGFKIMQFCNTWNALLFGSWSRKKARLINKIENIKAGKDYKE